MTIEYYYAPYSSASRVTWAIEELAVPCTKIRKDLKAGETHTADYLTLNPNGKVPLLVVDGRPLFESLAILIYLGERFGVDKKLWPAPSDPTREAALSWLVWGTVELGSAIARFVYAISPEDKKAANDRVNASLQILEAHLASRPYQLGESFSLVDLANSAALAWGRMVGIDLTSFPNVATWVDRCHDRPALRASMAL
ncbi:glutathione S-transferase family protein [Pendulispora albinea]|uniref:Glutathione S-transferase family protein n=1 Tax=Pendulispora albinea TaxID=2741071 RepID=A0ABZ2M3F8_9BACT